MKRLVLAAIALVLSACSAGETVTVTETVTSTEQPDACVQALDMYGDLSAGLLGVLEDTATFSLHPITIGQANDRLAFLREKMPELETLVDICRAG